MGLKETRSVTMNIFRKKTSFLFKSFVKIELSYVFTITCNMFSTAKLHGKANYLIKTGVFLLFVIIYVPPIILDSLFLT